MKKKCLAPVIGRATDQDVVALAAAHKGVAAPTADVDVIARPGVKDVAALPTGEPVICSGASKGVGTGAANGVVDTLRGEVNGFSTPPAT